jgi:hypothetical protein
MRPGHGGRYYEEEMVDLMERSKKVYEEIPVDTAEPVRKFQNAIGVSHADLAKRILKVLGARVTETPNGFFFVRPSIISVDKLSLNGTLLGNAFLIKTPQPIGTILYGAIGTLVSEHFPKGVTDSGTVIADQKTAVVLPITGSIQV